MAERRTITVHAFDDVRIHLALAHLGRLQQGRLETLCGRLAVTQLSPFAAAAAKAADRCRVCFGKVDEDGLLKAELAEKRARKAKPAADVIDLAAAREAKAAPAVAPASLPTPQGALQAKAARTTKAQSRPRPAQKRKPAEAKPAFKPKAIAKPRTSPRSKPKNSRS